MKPINIDIEIVRELLDCDPDAGALTWRHRDQKWFANEHDCNAWNTRYAGTPAFTAPGGRGYLRGKIQGTRYATHRVIWAWVHGAWPDQIDHINGVKDDNRIANLRDVSSLENGQNRSRPVTNTSGVVGVVWHKSKQRWQAQIGVNNRMIFIGQYENFDDAVAARKSAEVEYGYHENHGRGVAA